MLGALLPASIVLVACSGDAAQRDYDLLFTDVAPLEYARVLCARIPLQERHGCMTSVLRHHRDHRDREREPSDVVNGPFVMVLGQDLYRGSYVSEPFAAAFTVSNGFRVCRGRYNAFAGDTRAVFAVRCDDGSRGTANIILDRSGANGIGEVSMDDGTSGQIVFGYTAVGGEFL
ncbi:MAG: hypothetical protein PVH47_03715 [Thiohalocapsa sp.]